MQHPDTPVNYGKSLGRVAFEAYSAEAGGKTFDGKDIPSWDDLHGDKPKVQAQWEAAARAVADMVINNRTKNYNVRV